MLLRKKAALSIEKRIFQICPENTAILWTARSRTTVYPEKQGIFRIKLTTPKVSQPSIQFLEFLKSCRAVKRSAFDLYRHYGLPFSQDVITLLLLLSGDVFFRTWR